MTVYLHSRYKDGIRFLDDEKNPFFTIPTVSHLMSNVPTRCTYSHKSLYLTIFFITYAKSRKKIWYVPRYDGSASSYNERRRDKEEGAQEAHG